jgi:hypothetical protein
VIAATSFALLAAGCSSDTTSTDKPTSEAPAVAEGPVTASASAPAVSGIKGAPRNGGGIVYHRSDCSYGNVRFYGVGGDGPGSICGGWLTFKWQADIVHSFDWNFRLEDLDNLRQAHFDYTMAVNNGSAGEARDRERAFFDAVNAVNGGRGNAYTDLINNNLPGHSIGDGQATPGRWR